ncbi:diguanylate cyclase [Rhodoferax sp. PAMC 29310]|uniref:diguanylate cyclase n=1 Tax=Rhodoferax sp. PAMC 29310 TaxID=2822760 RepID=UPI001B3339BB|nr:diguanylate cyclase [Rhodoferax sp. PAMC 29310]
MIDRTSQIDTLLGADTGKPKLLVVDDQAINIQVIHQIFASDCQVFMATNGPQALAICKDNPPDLVLLDIVMPGIDGLEVCAKLQADEATRNIPVIFVTAHSDPAQETEGLLAGAVDFISKPVNPAVVRARVQTHLTLKFQSDLLRQLVFLDGLTGVYNRRHFDQQLDKEWGRATRNESALSVILIDVDNFKRYNDRYGHQSGDDCLKSIAKTLKKAMRRSADMVARYGGEEFVCILPDTSFQEAMFLAQHLEGQIRALEIPHEDSDISPWVTISLGVSARVESDDIGLTTATDQAELVSRADARLYRAKSSGRGQACCD